MANCIPFHSYMIGTGKERGVITEKQSKLKEYQTIGNEPYEKNFDCR